MVNSNSSSDWQRKAKIAASFSASADNYDALAEVQRLAAKKLAGKFDAASLTVSSKILEIGCGTGFLGSELIAKAPKAFFLLTDISLKMLRKCHSNLASSSPAELNFAVMDGEFPATKSKFDLVAASLAFQWFNDLGSALERIADCLTESGTLIFATLGNNSFSEWRSACDELGLPCGVPAFPARETLESLIPPSLTGNLAEEHLKIRRPDCLTFLRELKIIGAGSPAPAYKPLAAGQLRKAAKLFDLKCEKHPEITYHLLYGIYKKKR